MYGKGNNKETQDQALPAGKLIQKVIMESLYTKCKGRKVRRGTVKHT